MGTKEELVKELKKIRVEHSGLYVTEHIADFILADRKRIVEPLVAVRKEWFPVDTDVVNAIKETLKRAGID